MTTLLYLILAGLQILQGVFALYFLATAGLPISKMGRSYGDRQTDAKLNETIDWDTTLVYAFFMTLFSFCLPASCVPAYIMCRKFRNIK